MNKPAAPLLSIGMIFKNEARCLERCLKSLEPLRQAIPCELVMADTGATDGSRAIAEQYADEVFDFAWIDDFAAARNAVLDRCSGEWYFSLDCDEWLDADITELVAFLQSRKKTENAFVIQRNYRTKGLEKEESFSDFRALRLLRMSTGRRFYGTIHETFGYLEPAERLTHTILHHDGYVYASPEAKKKKAQRNMILLRQKLKQEPENLRTLLQCIESGRHDPDFLQYVRQGVAMVQTQKNDWEVLGPCILCYAVDIARVYELQEYEEWAAYTEKEFPSSIFTKVDFNYTAFLMSYKAKEWNKATRYGEAYRKGLQVLRGTRHSKALEAELGRSSLLYGSRLTERNLLIGLADAYTQTGQGKKALALLCELEGEKLTPDQVRLMTVALCQLQAQSELDIAPAFSTFYEQIGQALPDRQQQKARLAAFDATAAVPFTEAYQKEEREKEHWQRPAYTAFLPLAEKCEAGRGAAILMSTGPAEIREWLLKVENWQALPIEALEHALAAGVTFPLKEKPLNIEVLDGLAARLTYGANPARQWALALAEDQTFPSLQRLAWARALSLAALRSFDWTLGKKPEAASEFACPEKPQEDTESPRPKDTPEVGLALLRAFARLEAAALPLQYTPQLLTEENAALLPPMHRWGFYCTRAFAALDAGDPQGYLAALRKGLAACPGEKGMVQFLLDRFLEDARPKADPELLALAEKVRGILAAYPPNDPAVAALRESPAYRQVAWLVEPGPGSGLPGTLVQ